LLRRVLAVGLLAGLVAGLAIAAVQHVTTTPIILAAEVFEAAQHAHEAATPAWEPAPGFERTAATSVATIAVSAGYALLLLGAMVLAGERIEPKRAALWAACAFAATGLATGMGLAPQLPGMAETDLAARQIWWFSTACATGAGLFALLRIERPAAKAAGVLLILAPHLLGAPQPATPESAVPAELAARFAAASLSLQAMTWILAGLCAALFWKMFAKEV
jgi:cobalt transporter subunit CbtA